MTCLLDYMEVPLRMTRVKEGLDGGLLRAIVLCAGRQDVGNFDNLLQVLLDLVIPQALVYSSVLRRLRPALDSVEHLTRSRAFCDSQLFSVWQIFVQVATDRLHLLAKFDRGGIGQTRACDHIDCGSPIRTDDDLMRCSRCRSAFYCSTTCQSQDWAEHKKLCPSLLERDPQLAYLSPELEFLRAVLNHDYELARADVSARHTEVLETHPSALCSVVVFDYRRGLAVQLGSVPAYPDVTLTRYHGARVARSGGRLKLHVMVLYEGNHSSQWLVFPMRVEGGGSSVALVTH